MDEVEFKYSVYIKLNSDNDIIAVNSNAFLSDTTNWIKIDEGDGDKYHHAQGNYFDKPIIDENGCYNYKYVDNEVIERTNEDKQPQIDKQNAYIEISKLKSYLTSTDYVAIKIAEGVATADEYSEVITKRAEARTRINELEEI